MTTPTLTQTEFAAHIGASKSHVTALKKAGRLALDDQGRVLVEQSKALIASTTSAPERGGVVAPRFSEARTQKELYEAANARADFEERCGRLVPAADQAHAIANAGTQLRTRIEAMCDALAPKVAPVTDEGQVRAILADWAESTLTELAHLFAELAARARAKAAAPPAPAPKP